MPALAPRAQALRRDAPARRVLAQRRHEVLAGLHPLALHAQDVDDVGILDRLDVGRHLAAHRLDPARDQRRRADERHLCAHQRQRLDVRAGDLECRTSPTIATCRPSSGPTCSSIVYRSSSACVGCWCLPSPALTTWASVTRRRGSGRDDVRVADDDHIGVVRVQRQRVSFSDSPLSTDEPLDLTDMTSRREPLRGELEGARRSRRGLEEEVDDGAAAKRRQLLHLALERALEGARGREQASRRRRRVRSPIEIR